MTDDDRHDQGDEFWGSTPDWTDDAARPRRVRRDSDITGAIKNLWGSAMASGASPTREHRIVDAADAPTPRSTAGAIDPGLFDDLDDDFELPGDDAALHATTEIPRVDARRRHAATLVPAATSDGGDRKNNRIDPLLARIGAVAVVTTLLVPLGIGLGSGDSDDTISTASSEAPASVVTLPAATTVTPSDTSVDASSSLDPAELPPAVPANSDTAAPDVAQPSPNDDDATSTAPSSVSDDATSAAPTTDDGADDSPTAADTEAILAEKVCAIDYVVQTGDYWIGLADAAGVPLAELLDANAATSSTALYPGADICLPAGSSTPSTTVAPTTAAPTTDAPTTTAETDAGSGHDRGADDRTHDDRRADDDRGAPTSPAGPEDIKQIIRDVWPDDLEEKALEIAFRESRYVPTAQNFCCYGLFQIYWEVHDSWLAGIGVTSADQLFDPATNARAAYALYQRAGGWGPWSQTAY